MRVNPELPMTDRLSMDASPGAELDASVPGVIPLMSRGLAALQCIDAALPPGMREERRSK